MKKHYHQSVRQSLSLASKLCFGLLYFKDHYPGTIDSGDQMSHPDNIHTSDYLFLSGVKGTATTSNNTAEVEKVLGIEAARF